ncbi:SDR family NAD(P)-dependent oxidoreductase [Ruania rhizosphaerae]|uniref:SDR family NAD(P)-dependent oxidoreductase n=1 Tax=Ruania rhizosphaerae TaxID=1840413 RepID=UPI001357C8EB|nr:SDR family oxidoreductase [Ruania rhizosphaerae]
MATTPVVLITGAAGGIGSAMARRFAADGAALELVDVRPDGLADVAAGLVKHGVAVHTHTADITDETAVDALFAEINDRTRGVDVLINNAAYAYDEDLHETTPDRWDEQVAIALRAPYLCTRAALPTMRERGHGVVCNISSVNAYQYYGNAAYSAAKSGLNSLTRSTAVRYGRDGIRAFGLGVGTVITPGAWDERRRRDPGIIDRVTRWYPAGRLGTPEDIANAAAFLSSEDASWITGTTLMIDGGLTAGNNLLAADVLSGEN